MDADFPPTVLIQAPEDTTYQTRADVGGIRATCDAWGPVQNVLGRGNGTWRD